LREVIHAYLAATSFMDDCVGRILDALEASPHADNTIVVFWADHGWSLGDHFHWKKWALWECASNVPLIITRPGDTGGKICRTPVSTLHIDRQNTSLRGIISENSVTAVRITGQEAIVALIDCQLNGGCASEPAIVHGEGFLFARNIDTSGYACALTRAGGKEVPGSRIEEYTSTTVQVLWAKEDRRSLNLPIEEVPEIPWENDHSQWACVNDFGAVGDGKTDNTEAIRKAIATGKPVVWFQPGIYMIDEVIDLPASLKRLNFMKCDLGAGDNLRQRRVPGGGRRGRPDYH